MGRAFAALQNINKLCLAFTQTVRLVCFLIRARQAHVRMQRKSQGSDTRGVREECTLLCASSDSQGELEQSKVRALACTHLKVMLSKFSGKEPHSGFTQLAKQLSRHSYYAHKAQQPHDTQ